MRAQSELIVTVILVTLTIVVGVAGFALASSWAFSRYSESSFSIFSELVSNEFLVFPISVENRGSSVVVYVGVIRIGLLQDSYSLYVSIHNSSFYTQKWWALNQLSSFGYNVSSIQAFLGNLSFSSASSSRSVDVSRLYARYAGSWYSLRDLGAQGFFNVYSVGVLGIDRALFLNITVPSSTQYIYVVLWAGYNDRYVAIPSVITVT
ncbi:MAG TPA: hypothetical protein VNL13_01805 [Sulfolobales archaeon]|nr:hypothetical protein [Sulfolobales archaeon]